MEALTCIRLSSCETRGGGLVTSEGCCKDAALQQQDAQQCDIAAHCHTIIALSDAFLYMDIPGLFPAPKRLFQYRKLIPTLEV